MKRGLEPNGPQRRSPGPERSSLRPERRQLTVLFVDIVASTALSESLDPEEFFAILRDYRDICDYCIQRYGGSIGETSGDGLLAYFGLPNAHENDAERAVYAGLSIVASIGNNEFATTASRRRLSVRVAVNTGLVMVGKTRNRLAAPAEIFGTTAHIAARLQSVAAANEVVVGRPTYELVRGAFNCTALGEQDLRGVSEPVAVWRVDSVRSSEGRFERSQTAPLTPRIDRVQELAKLQDLWRASAQGSGSIAVISGDPGIGKSRLVQDFRNSIVAERMETFYLQCSPLHVNTPLSPEIERIRRVAALHETDSVAQATAKLRSLLGRTGADVEEAMRYYGALLAIPPGEGFTPADLSSTRERDRALGAMVDMTLAMARRSPLLMIVEDAQWMDPTSAELLQRLMGQARGHRIFLLITHRSDWAPPWRRDQQICAMPLARLSPEDCEEMIKVVAGDASFGRAVLGKIVQRTDGVPLFIEEFTRALLDSRAAAAAASGGASAGESEPRLPDQLIPTTIKDSLTERLDRLGNAKRIAQIAAIFGRSFSFEALHSLTGMPRSRLLDVIGKIEARGLLHRTGKTDGRFMFRHALIQEAAYESLLKEERRELHARAAVWLRSVQDHASGHLAELGYHYSRAGLAEEAVACWLEAGKSALGHAANKEAIASLQEGLGLISSLPASPERNRDEIELQLNLALAYTALIGWHAPAVDRSYSRALELCRDFGTLRQKSIAFWGLTIAKTVSCELAEAREFSREFVAFAESAGDLEAILMAHAAAVIANFFLGDLAEAQAAAAVVFARYDPQRHRGIADVYQHDPKILALVYSGHIEWILGRPQKARNCCEEARRAARDLGHPFMLSLALILGASDHLYEHELAENLAAVEEGIAIAREHGFRMYEFFGHLWAIEAVAARGPAPDCLAKLEGLIARLLERNCYLQAPLYQVWLAEEWARIGRLDKANALARAAEEIMRRTRERWFEPEVFRVRALLLSHDPSAPEGAAKDYYRRAMASARALATRGWELRAAIGLAQLLASDGDRAQASQLLADIRSRFADGDVSADLRIADEMLQDLQNFLRGSALGMRSTAELPRTSGYR